MQRDQVSRHQAKQNQRQRDHVERKEAVQRCVANRIVAANPDCELRPDKRNRREDVHDHLRAPERHLAPREQIAEEGFSHQAQVNQHAEDPRQFTWLAVAAVHQAATHVQVNHDEEHRRAGRVHVANQPTVVDVAHDVLNRAECVSSVRLVVHRQEDTGDDLQHEHEKRERAEVVPKVEVFWCVVIGS